MKPGQCIRLFVLLVLAACLTIFSSAPADAAMKTTPRAVRGVCSLERWDLAANGPLYLKGEWEFYWQSILLPADFSKANPPQAPDYVQLPNVWSEKKMGGKALPAYGYATYRLRVTGIPRGTTLSLKTPSISSASDMYLNGVLIHRQGRVSTDPATFKPALVDSIRDFTVDADEIEIVVTAANYFYAKGGMWEVPQLGRAADIHAGYTRRLSLDFFMFGSILIMGFYHLGLFLLRKKDRAPLYFAIYSLLLGFRTLVTSERALYAMFPQVPWHLFIRGEYLTFYVSVPCFYLFFQSLFPDDIPRPFTRALSGLSALFSLIVLCTPVSWFTRTILPWQIIASISATYVIARLVLAAVRKREGALIILLGFIAVFITTMNDILYHHQLIFTGDLFAYGLFLFLFSQAFSLSNRYSKAFTEIEDLSSELGRKVRDLDDAYTRLSLSEEKYRLLIEGSNDIIFTLNDRWNFITANNGIKTHLNIRPENVHTMNFLDLIYEGIDGISVTKDIVREKLEQLSRDKVPLHFKIDFKSPISTEPREMMVTLEYLNIEGRNEILGKASRIMEDVLLKYFVSEEQEFVIENYLIVVEDISHRITRNIQKYIGYREINFIRIALREMMINAIEHGNLNISFEEKSDALDAEKYIEFISTRQHNPLYRHKKVHVAYYIGPDQLRYVITDEGSGFDHRSVLAGSTDRANEDMLSHGRGIAMAMQVFDSVDFNEKGNSVTLVKRIRRGQ